MKKNRKLILKAAMSAFISCFYSFAFVSGISYGAEKAETEDMYLENPVSRVDGIKFKEPTSDMEENGKLKVSNFPKRPNDQKFQGTFKAKDIHDDIIMDMNLPNEAVPKGAHDFQQVGGWFYLKKPTGYNSINPWGQVFLIDGEECPENTYIDIRNLSLICYMKNEDGTKEWKLINLPNTIGGKFYSAHYYKEEKEIEPGERLTTNVDGVTINMPGNIIDEPNHTRCFHFWTDRVDVTDYIEKYGDIEYTIVSCEVRLSPNNENIEEKKNKFVFDVGADCKSFDSKGAQVPGSAIQEVAGGRYKIVTDEYRRVYATDLPYNKYFDIVSEDQIDRLLYGIS